MLYKNLFFDLDDTLYDRSVPYCKAFTAFFGGRYAEQAMGAFLQTMLRGYEVFAAAHTGQMTMEAMHIYRHQTGLRDVGIEITPEEALQMQALYAEQQCHISLTPVMKETLSFCQAHFAAVGVITNGGVQSQQDKLKSLGVERWIRPELVLISDALGVMKPAPDIFRLAERAAGARAEDCVYVGDSYSQDVASAGGCGWETLWLNRRGGAAGDLAPTYCVREERELLACLKAMTQEAER